LEILQHTELIFLEWLHFKSKSFHIPHQTMLSNFDIHIGPTVIFLDIENQERNNFKISETIISSLMDIHSSDDFFIHFYNGFLSINYYFEVYNKNIRGGANQFMASIIFKDLDNKSMAKVIEHLDDFKLWSKTIKISIHNQKIANELIDLKITCELNDINHNINQVNQESD
jgi:hypothetical protein